MRDQSFPPPILEPNDRRAAWMIWVVSVVVFIAVAFLAKVRWDVSLPFDPHIFPRANALINSIVALLLIAGLWAVKKRQFILHKQIMIAAIILSVLFLLSYICHHLLTGDTKFGDIDHDNVVSDLEKAAAGKSRYIYYFILITHIPLAGVILPFILFTAYRALTGDYQRHIKLARITWPVWFYVAVTGVVVYFMISPYYS